MSDTIRTLTETMRGRVIIASDSDHDDVYRATEIYGANDERLSAVKAPCDPGNLFSVNQNIASAKRR